MPRSPTGAASLGIALIAGASMLAGCLPAPTVATRESSAPASENPRIATPKPSATPKASDIAVQAFVRQVAGDRLTYRIEFSGEARLSVNRLPITGTMDVAGGDFASSFTYDFDPDYPGLGKVRIQVRGVGGKGWIKRGSAAWQQIKTYSAAQSYVPFKDVDAPEDARYVGATKIGGKTFHKILVKDALLIHPNTIPYQIQKEKVDESEIELLIDDAGRPRSGTWTLRGQGRVGPGNGQLQRVVYELKLTFSKVGAKLSVKRP